MFVFKGPNLGMKLIEIMYTIEFFLCGLYFSSHPVDRHSDFYKRNIERINERIYLYSLGIKKENEFRRETDPTNWKWTENMTGVAKEKRQSYFQFDVNSSSLFDRERINEKNSRLSCKYFFLQIRSSFDDINTCLKKKHILYCF